MELSRTYAHTMYCNRVLSEFEIEFRQKITTTKKDHAQSTASEIFLFLAIKSK